MQEEQPGGHAANARPVVSQRAWQMVAESKIERAIEEGEFANLPGFGKPLAQIDNAVNDELSWMKERLKSEGLSPLPPALELKRVVAATLLEILELAEEASVIAATETLNAKIETANLQVLWGPPSTTMPLEVELVLERWRLRSPERAARSPNASNE